MPEEPDEDHYDEDGTCLECGAAEDEYHEPDCSFVGDDDEEEEDDPFDETIGVDDDDFLDYEDGELDEEDDDE